jgi:hypothetical protein
LLRVIPKDSPGGDHIQQIGILYRHVCRAPFGGHASTLKAIESKNQGNASGRMRGISPLNKKG